MTLGSPSPPSQTHSLCFLSTQCCSKLCTIVCLGRLLQGGAPLLVFVQPVRELLGPFDLSLTLSLEILSPFTQAITLTWCIIEGKISFYPCGDNINLYHQLSERSFEFVWNWKDDSFSLHYSLSLINKKSVHSGDFVAPLRASITKCYLVLSCRSVGLRSISPAPS